MLHDHAGPVADLAFDPRGQQLASASGGALGSDNVVRLWNATREVGSEFQRNRALYTEARRRVLNVVRDSGLRLATAHERLDNWAPRSEWGRQVHQLALTQFNDFITRPGYFWENAWRVISQTGLSAEEYNLALHWANRAAHIAPETAQAIGARGAAEYRCGHLHEALQSLAMAKAIDGSFIPPRAFLAMAHVACRNPAKAERELAEIRMLQEDTDGSVSVDSEALRLIEDANSLLRTRESDARR